MRTIVGPLPTFWPLSGMLGVVVGDEGAVMARAAALKARVLRSFGLGGAVAFAFAFCGALAESPVNSPAIKIAVFDFELDDLSPAGAQAGSPGGSAAAMRKVSDEARRELAESGRYQVIDPEKMAAKVISAGPLRNCDGCEAGIALQLGAQQSLLGVVRKATQTDYYVAITIRDARTGKIVDQQEANFAGSEEGWPAGARMLIKHQVLVSDP